MNEEKANLYSLKFGLTKLDFDDLPFNDENAIDLISNSLLLYHKALSKILLNRLQEYLGDEDIGFDDDLATYFPFKGRKAEWSRLRNGMGMEIPTLKFTRFAIAMAWLLTVTFLSLTIYWFNTDQYFIEIFELMRFSTLTFIVSVILVLVFGLHRLPGKKVEDFIYDTASVNKSHLLSDDKTPLKEMLLAELRT